MSQRPKRRNLRPKLPEHMPWMTDEQWAIYLDAFKNSRNQKFALMCALRQAPGTLNTERAFMAGRQAGHQFDRQPRELTEYLVDQARRAGVSIAGKDYKASLARYSGDPEAWVSGKDDVLRIAKKRKLRVEGMVNYEPPEEPPRPPVRLAPDLIQEKLRQRLADDPGLLTRRKHADVVEEIIEKHAPKPSTKTMDAIFKL